jgi:hypothetical protein
MSQPDVAGGSLHGQDVHHENDCKATMEIFTADAGPIEPQATPNARPPPAPFLRPSNARSQVHTASIVRVSIALSSSR